jgi:hypothetical protein
MLWFGCLQLDLVRSFRFVQVVGRIVRLTIALMDRMYSEVSKAHVTLATGQARGKLNALFEN